MIRDMYVKGKFLLIKDAIKQVEKFKGDRIIAGYLDAYLVVLISGVYEDCIEYMLNTRVAKTGDVEVAVFIEKTLDMQFRNPSYENLINIIGRFSKKWVTTMNKRIKDEAKTSLNNIVTNKNSVAHGGTCSLTLNEIKNCHKKCKSIFEKLEKLCRASIS